MSTRLGLSGVTRSPYGPFSGKSSNVDPKPLVEATRLGLGGFPRSRYGVFSGKSEGIVGKPVLEITRLGLYGGARGLMGDFSGKSAEIILPKENGVYRGRDESINQIRREDEEMIALISAFMEVVQ